ncbi:hypothetical protein BT96DRAFT_1007696 [Gymnopus androsaceus JB14]|uniref:Uncharacterized protein n=1 Tax=Gymnopus androsaceus JB14 TaxID=1447944 RepID=A0A6A4GHQ4_9AGAR|nr:hypothetical protein BT96DRAFT_1007696 [Gymnopus androsaceus JB14]
MTDPNPSPNFPVVPGPAPDFIDVSSSSDNEHTLDRDFESDDASAMNVQPSDAPAHQSAWLTTGSPTYGNGGWGSKGSGWGNWGHRDPALEVLNNVREDFKTLAKDVDPFRDTTLDPLDTPAWVKAQLFLSSETAHVQSAKLPTFTQQQLGERLVNLRAQETLLSADFARAEEESRQADAKKNRLGKAMEDLKVAEEQLLALHLVAVTRRRSVQT